MFCPQCGKENSSNNTVCENCGAPLWSDSSAPQEPQQAPVEPVQQPQEPAAPPPVNPYNQQPFNAVPPPPPAPNYGQPYAPVPPQQPVPQVTNYLVWSILNILFCCLPLGIAATVYSSKVNNLLMIGDYNGAMQASKTAKTLNLIATIGGVVLYIILFATGVFSAILGSGYYY